MNVKNKILIAAAIFFGFAFMLASEARAAQSPQGSNVSIDGVVYQIGAGERRPYTDANIFLSYGYAWVDVVPAGPEDIALKVGAPMPPRDGTVVCSNAAIDKGACYLITDYQKVAFASLDVLTQQGFSLAEAIVADISFVNPAAPIMNGADAHRYGTVIDRGGAIYFVGKNGLIAVPDTETLLSWGYKLSDVVPASEGDKQLQQKLTLEKRFAGEPRPFEPTIPAPLELANKDKFIVPLADELPEITEAWLYSSEERAIHGFANHGGIDFAAPRGTPVYAAADGYAVSSTHLSVLDKTYEDKTVGFGLGEFVQIWHPAQGVYTSYSHLQKVENDIPYFKPECDQDGFCDPEIVYHDTSYIRRRGAFVRQGELIGYIGDSGLSWGYEEMPRKMRNYRKEPSWDETHLHFEVYTRDEERFLKSRRYDPFGLYGRRDQYAETSYSNPSTLWKLDKNNQPVLAE